MNSEIGLRAREMQERVNRVLPAHGYVRRGSLMRSHEFDDLLPHRLYLDRDKLLEFFDHIEENGMTFRPWTFKLAGADYADGDSNPNFVAMFESEVDLVTVRLITG